MIEELKKGAYWRVMIRPHLGEGTLLSLSECRELVKGCHVRLRERPFPYFKPEKVKDVEGAIQCVHDGKTHREWWRMDPPARFEHYASLREDDPLTGDVFAEALDLLLDETTERGWDDYSGAVGVSSVLFQLTEYFTFLSGYVRALSENIKEFDVAIGLHGVRNRVLVEMDFEKKWNMIFKTGLEEIQIPERVFTRGELIAHADDLAVDTALHFYQGFHWTNPDRNHIEKEQQRFFQDPSDY